MAVELHYQFFHEDRLIGSGAIEVPFTVGRQTGPSEVAPVTVLRVPVDSKQYLSNDCVERKLVIVPLSNRAVPRLSLKVDVDGSGNILARNVHRAVDLQLPNRSLIRPREQLTLGSEGTICFPDAYQLCLMLEHPRGVSHRIPGRQKTERAPLALPSEGTVRQTLKQQIPIQLKQDPADADHQSSYSPLLFEHAADESGAARLLSMIDENQASRRQEIAVRLVRTALEAFKQPPGSREFFAAAGKAAVQMIDLDRVAVLRKWDNEWVCSALSFREGLDETRAAAREFSQTLLSRMEAAGKTMIFDPQMQAQSVWGSITEVDRAVASPIFGADKSIVGALYGDRLVGESDSSLPIGELEAALLEVLASGISSSLEIKQEQRFRSSMAQFFSPVVLSQLKQNRSLLDGRVADVSVLFCDIRGFSSVTERIGPTKAIEWINDVLTTLSECVLAQDGVLVNYIGDELLAMWGAPGDQPDHAERACRAALDMLSQIQPLGEKWKDIMPERFGFGIGINSGPASVGNTGSKKLFKYGPIGNTVNLASRVQGITRQIGVPGLITGETARLAKRTGIFQTRRLCKVRVVGIEKPLDLFQLCQDESQRNLCKRYEDALSAYEASNWKLAAGRLAAIVQDYPDDRPTIILLSRTVELLTQRESEFDPVWNLTEK